MLHTSLPIENKLSRLKKKRYKISKNQMSILLPYNSPPFKISHNLAGVVTLLLVNHFAFSIFFFRSLPWFMPIINLSSFCHFSIISHLFSHQTCKIKKATLDPSSLAPRPTITAGTIQLQHKNSPSKPGRQPMNKKKREDILIFLWLRKRILRRSFGYCMYYTFLIFSMISS